MGEVSPGGVPFQEAISYLRNKIDLPTRTWTDLWKGQHARAFVVAGAVKSELVADFHSSVLKAIEEGRTLNDFRKDFDKIVAKHGWSYNGSRKWRSALIYNTNMRMARNAGRWAQIERLKSRRPYVRYVAVKDTRTRPEHLAWHDTVLPVDDAFWRTHAPPNGWNCRCQVQSLSERNLKRHGHEVSDKAPDIEVEAREVNTPEGKVKVDVPKGIDTGFDYNVGDASWGRGAERVAMEKHGSWTKLDLPGGNRPSAPGLLTSSKPTASLGGRVQDEDGLRAALRSAIGGDEKIFTDPVGGRVGVSQSLVDHMIANTNRMDGREAYFPLIPELIEKPAEIWVGFAQSEISGRVLLRRRYVRLFDLGNDRTLGLVADLDRGQFAGTTFFRGNARGLQNLRSGLRIYQE